MTTEELVNQALAALGEFPERQDGLEYAPLKAPDTVTVYGPDEPPDELSLALRKQAEAAADPLREVARQLRALTLEHITSMCKAMGKPEMRDTLVQWAISYLDGTEMPKDDRRF